MRKLQCVYDYSQFTGQVWLEEANILPFIEIKIKEEG